MMAGLDVPARAHVGRFRGELGLEAVRVRIGPLEGAPPGEVRRQLLRFERALQRVVAALDARYPPGHVLDHDGVAA